MNIEVHRWTKIGTSPMYEVFTGSAELLMAVLLFVPRFTTVGALVGLAVSFQIWMLNMTYDVPVKLFSFHLILMSLVLLAPNVRRLVDFLVLNRQTAPIVERPLFRNRIACRIAVAAQLIFGVWVLWGGYQSSSAAYSRSATVAPKPPLYGVWAVDRWRRLVVQSPTSISFQRMDDTFIHYRAAVDMAAGNIAITIAQKPGGSLHIEQPADGKLVLDGEIGARRIRLEATRFDHNSWNMVSSRFRWMQDTPFNR